MMSPPQKPKGNGCSIGCGGFFLLMFVVWLISLATNTPETAKTPEQKKQEQVGDKISKQLAKNMATGEVILMASCLGKNGSIPREKMGDYIAAALEKQGISRSDLSANWDKYFSYAKDAEKRNGTSCLE